MIPAKQNEDRQLQRLAAQRQLYATAKTVFGWQIFLSGLVPVVFAIIVLSNPSLKGLAATWGIFIILVDIFLLTTWQKRLRDLAARIQEVFDCDVLDLPWNELKAGKKPEPELIKEQSDKYAKWAARMTPITDWYAKSVGDLPIHIGRIACQRSNIWWNAKQRRRYAVCVISVVISVVVIVFVVSIGTSTTTEDFIIKMVAPLAPLILLGIRQYREQMEAATRLDSLKDHSERLWKDALSGKSKSKLTRESRNLQDEILENRKKSPLVFDFVFQKLRQQYEEQMYFGVEEFVAEAKKKGI